MICLWKRSQNADHDRKGSPPALPQHDTPSPGQALLRPDLAKGRHGISHCDHGDDAHGLDSHPRRIASQHRRSKSIDNRLYQKHSYGYDRLLKHGSGLQRLSSPSAWPDHKLSPFPPAPGNGVVALSRAAGRSPPTGPGKTRWPLPLLPLPVSSPYQKQIRKDIEGGKRSADTAVFWSLPVH